jgi:hypothetical protein
MLISPLRVLIMVLLCVFGLLPEHAKAATYTVTSTSCTGPGSLLQAIADANANPGADTITFTPGLVIRADMCPPDSQTQPSRYYIGEVTESVVFEGRGARLVGALGWINSSGVLQPITVCPRSDLGTVVIAETPGFLRVGRYQQDNSAISVTIRDMSFEQLSSFVRVNDKASLVVDNTHLLNIWDNHMGCGRPVIRMGIDGNLAVRSSTFKGLVNFGSSNNGYVWTGGIEGIDGGTLEVTDSTFSDSATAGAIVWGKGPARIVGSRFANAGGIQHLAGSMDIVDSVFAFARSGETDRIMQIHTARSSAIRLIASSVWAQTPGCDSTPKWGPCNFVGRPLLAEGSTISLIDSAVGIGLLLTAAPTLGKGVSGTGWYTANERTWIQPSILGQDAAALKVITGQPALLTGLGLPSGFPAPYPENVTPLAGGVLVDAIANAAPSPPGPGNGANVLISPIDGQPLLRDAFGSTRWDAANGKRSIGGVQNEATRLSLDGVSDQTARLSWTRPKDIAGLPVTGYRVLYALPGQIPAAEVFIGNPATTTLNLGSLVNGSLYTFEVIPVSGATPLAASNVVQGTPMDVPDAPVVTATPANGQVDLSWTVPPGTGSPLNGYLLRYRQVGSPTWWQWPFPPSITSTVVRQLVNGVAYEFTVAASNFVGQGSAGTVLATPLAVPALTYPGSVTGYENNALTIAPTPSDITGPVGYAVTSGSLPTGLSLDSGTGIISGTPASGTGSPTGTAYPVTVTLTQTGITPATATASLTIRVINNPPDPALFYPDIRVVAGTGVLTVAQTVGGFSGVPTYSIVGTPLPPGFTLNANGTISGNPATATSDFIATTVRAQSGVQIAQAPLIIEISPKLGYGPGNGVVGTALSLGPVVSPVVTPGTFTLTTGTLPNGLLLNAATGVITGIPSVAGFTTVSITFTTGTQSVRASFPLTISGYPLALTYPSTTFQIGVATTLSPQVSGAIGGRVYSLVSGQLPAGLSLDPASGLISGVPTGPSGSTVVSVQLADLYTSAVCDVLMAVALAPTPVPTLGEYALLMLAAMLAVFAAWRLKREQQ